MPKGIHEGPGASPSKMKGIAHMSLSDFDQTGKASIAPVDGDWFVITDTNVPVGEKPAILVLLNVPLRKVDFDPFQLSLLLCDCQAHLPAEH